MTAGRRAAVALAVAFSFCLGASGVALAKSRKHRHQHHHHHRKHGKEAEGAADGRSQLKRANALAGEGDCKAAIEAYTKAFELLNDPVVLFNRAECYRRTGDAERAVDDYRAFLDKVPSAPNRADIEAKIVALEVPEPAAREKPEKPEKPAAEEPAPPPPPKVVEAPKPSAPAPATPQPETKPAPAVTLVRAPSADDAGPSGGSRPWVWVALSVLVIGAAVGGYFLLRPHDPAPPDSVLGNYRL